VNFNDYQQKARRFKIYPRHRFCDYCHCKHADPLGALEYTVLGLTNEAGEVAGKVKKIARDQGGEITEENRKAILKELGDALWYLSATCDEIGAELSDVAAANIKKLDERAKKDTLHGDGDNR